MKNFFAFIFLVTALILSVYILFQSSPDIKRKALSNPHVREIALRFQKLRLKAKEVVFQEKVKPSHSNPTGKIDDSPRDENIGQIVTLYFKNGDTMSGELLDRTEQEYTLKWKDSPTCVNAKLVGRMEIGVGAMKDKVSITDEEISACWPYKNNIALRLNNRAVLDARIIDVNKNNIIVVEELEGGGTIEQSLARSDIYYLIFKPVDNESTKKVTATLKELFPKMNQYKEGNFTIVTDSSPNWVDKYRRAIREKYTEIYLEFFDLFKSRQPKIQNFLVIFDDYNDFIEYAVADGVPGLLVAGYFNPDDEILYLYNVFGEKLEELMFNAWVDNLGKSIDDVVVRIGSSISDRHSGIMLRGVASEIKDIYWEAYIFYRNLYIKKTLSTLRHEFTHEIFYNWGLQNITLSGPKDKNGLDRLVELKKKFLDEKDYNKKAKMLNKIWQQLERENESVEMTVANSWLAEGAATYCETEALGEQNDRWLSSYQDMVRDGAVYPLEYMMYYRIGSFPGACSKSKLQLYAQSWSFYTFLMKRYPKEFLIYQDRVAKTPPSEEEELAWLEEAAGKKIRDLENEFIEYMNRYEKVINPDNEGVYIKRHQLRDEFRNM